MGARARTASPSPRAHANPGNPSPQRYRTPDATLKLSYSACDVMRYREKKRKTTLRREFRVRLEKWGCAQLSLNYRKLAE